MQVQNIFTKKQLAPYLPLVLIIGVFLLLKLSNLGIRMSDTNIYFYTAYQLSLGKVLYKDIFFTNFPLFPYISVVYFFLLGKNLTMYFFSSVIETCVTASFIYYLAFKQTKSLLTSTFSILIYLFSFMILSTTDHQTGVFLASLFAVISYFFFERKQYALTGCFVALALLTKAYFLPIGLTYFLYLLMQNRKALFNFLLGGIGTTIIVLLPTVVFARNEFVKDVFLYSLTRSQGLSKSNILWFFVTHDLVFFLLFLWALLDIRRHVFFGLFAICSALFIFLYQDIYFLYLNFTLPFFSIFFAYGYEQTIRKLDIQKMVIPSLVSLLLFYNFFTYITGFRNLEKFTNLEEMKQTIEKHKPTSLYGANDTTPALAYLTHTPLLNNIVDTNENIFRKGFLHADQLTSQAIEQGSLFVGHGMYYPESNLNRPLINELFDLKQFETAQCKLIGTYPIQTEGLANRINFVSCAK